MTCRKSRTGPRVMNPGNYYQSPERHEDDTQILLDCLARGPLEDRMAAARELVDRGQASPVIAQFLTQVVQDDALHPELRVEAIGRLATIAHGVDPGQLIHLLEQGLRSNSVRMQVAAAFAVAEAKLAAPSLAALLLGLLETDDPERIEGGACGLASLGKVDGGILASLTQLVRTGSRKQILGAAYVLGQLGREAAAVLPALQDARRRCSGNDPELYRALAQTIVLLRA